MIVDETSGEILDFGDDIESAIDVGIDIATQTGLDVRIEHDGREIDIDWTGEVCDSEGLR